MPNKIKITITDEELEELKDGKVFNWNFDGIDVEISNGEEGEEW